MRKLLQFFLMFLFAVSINDVSAQNADTAKQWTFSNCIQYATTHNIQINTLRLNEETAAQDFDAAKGLKLPGLNASVGNTFNNANNDVSGSGNLVNQLSSTGSYAVNAGIVLWNGNYINNSIKQSDLLLQLAGLSIDQSVNNNSLLIAQAYLNILLAKENLKYVNDVVTTSAALVKQGQQFYDAGSVAKINLLQLQSQFAGDKYLLVQTQNSIRQNILLLKQLLQLPSDTLFDIVTPPAIEVVEILPSLLSVQQTALQIFPEIKIGTLGIDIAQVYILKARAAFKPTLSASAAIGSGYSDVITNSAYAKEGYLTQTNNNFYQRIGVALSIPIFSNRINRTNLEKAKINYRQSELDLQNFQLILSQAVEQAYLNTSNGIQAYAAANEQLIAATESFRIISEEFKLGGTNTFEVLQLRNQYVQAVQVFTQAKYTALLQYKIYKFYQGVPVAF